jgi:hypothetical protein
LIVEGLNVRRARLNIIPIVERRKPKDSCDGILSSFPFINVKESKGCGKKVVVS